MTNARTDFSCQITHHEFDHAEIEIVDCGDGVEVAVMVQDRHEGFSTANSRIKLTAGELGEIVELVERYKKAQAALKGEAA